MPGCSKSIQFELMSNLEVQSAAELHVYERNLYSMPQRTPLEHGVLDPRLVSARRLPIEASAHRD